MSSSAESWLIYGATGETGRRIVEAAVARGLRPTLSARDARPLAALADSYGLAYRLARIEQSDSLRAALSSCRLLLNLAGPFSATARPWLEACLLAGAHYLDISGEIDALNSVACAHEAARRRSLMLMPAVGFEAVASDCLSLHGLGRMPDARSLRLGLRGLGRPSRGSARSMAEQARLPVRIRRAGQLRSVRAGSLAHAFDFGDGPVPALAVSWGDSVTAYFSTALPCIETYFEATLALRWATTLQRMLQASDLGAWFRPELVAQQARFASPLTAAPMIVAELENARGERVCSRLSTPDVYAFTVASSLAIVERALAGDVEPGFQTPARVYGADFVLGFDGVSRMDL